VIPYTLQKKVKTKELRDSTLNGFFNNFLVPLLNEEEDDPSHQKAPKESSKKTCTLQ
jgi:hypothetical protein